MKSRHEASLSALGFLVAVAFVPGILDPGGVPRWAAIAVGVPLCLLALEHRDVSPWCFAWLPAAAVTIAWSPDPLHGADELTRLALMAGTFYLGACAPSLAPLWRGLAAGVAVSAAIAIAQLFGLDWFGQAAPPAGLFVNRNLLAEAGMVGLIAALASGWWMLAAWCAVAALVPFSKAVCGALAVALTFWLVLERRRIAWLAGAGLAAAAIAVIVSSPLSLEIRLGTWRFALGGLELFGRGLGAFAYDAPTALHAHNEPLQLVYELGLLALPYFALFLFAIGAPNGPRLERVVLCAIAAVSFFSFPIHAPLTAFAAALAAGHLCRVRHRVRDRDDAFAIPTRFCP